MLDIKIIRENPKLIEENLKKRKNEEKIKLLHALIESDKKYREGLQELEKLKHERNVISEEIARLKKEGKDFSKKIKEASEFPEKIKKL